MNRDNRRPARRLNRWLVALALAAGAAWAAPARAELVISVAEGIPATAGQTDVALDVSLAVTGTYNIGAFQFTLGLPAGSGVAFVGADLGSPDYIFPDSLGLGATVLDSGLTLVGGDLVLDFPGYATLSDTTVTLGRVRFRVDSSAPGGTVPVTLDTAADATLLLDEAGAPLGFSVRGGSIAVAGAAAPEPSSLVMSGIVLGMAGVLWSSRRSRAAE